MPQNFKPLSLYLDCKYPRTLHFTPQYLCIDVQHVVAAGDVAPLVGHNAFLRWNAVEECAFVDPKDGQLKYWSEHHVSEDFDMSVRLQIRNYIGRYISYTGSGPLPHSPLEQFGKRISSHLAHFHRYKFNA